MKLKTLDEIGNIQTGTTPKTSEPENFGDYIPFIKPSDFNADGTLCLESCEYLSEIGIGKGRLIPKHSVLMTCIGSIGKCGYNDIDVSCNQQINALTPHTDNYKYIYYVMKSGEFQTRIQNICPKTVVPIINKTLWGKLEISLPSREEQDKIVSILDKADEIRAKKKLANDKLDEFLKSTFISMFGDPVKNEKNLPLKLLKEVFTLSSGNFLPASQRDEHGECPVYGGNGIAGFHNEYMFEHSKLCIGRVGVKCGCIHITKPHSWITDNALYVKEYKTDINEIYLKMLLAIMNLNQYAKQSAQPQISQTTISNLAVIFPPIEDQNRFAQIVEHVEAQKQKNELVIEQMNNLFNSLSQRAFKEEL